MIAVDTFVIFFCRILTSCTTSAGKKPAVFVPRTYPSSKPQSVEPTTSMTSPTCIDKWPAVVLEQDSMQTTVVLGWPIEQAALSELVPTPDESLTMSLVSPMLLSVRDKKNNLIVQNDKKAETFSALFKTICLNVKEARVLTPSNNFIYLKFPDQISI